MGRPNKARPVPVTIDLPSSTERKSPQTDSQQSMVSSEEAPAAGHETPTPASDEHQQPPYRRRRPIPRKGHTKSRKGCSTCKSRKVKCDEVHPDCGPCRRLGLVCLYDSGRRAAAAAAAAEIAGSVSASVSASGSSEGEGPAAAGSWVLRRRGLRQDPMSFDVDDLRFFQHFLLVAYPSLPIDGLMVWQDVSQLSHQYDFLIHAMLGLGAAHLALVAPGDFAQASLRHRVTAIGGLNNFLSRAHLSRAHADAAFGAMLSLTFQASHMREGMVEYLTMIRGCYLVGWHALAKYPDSTFLSFRREHYVNDVKRFTDAGQSETLLDEGIAEQFCSSITRLAPHCSSVVELELIELIQQIVKRIAIDPSSSFTDHTKMWDKLGVMTPPQYAAFVEPANAVGRLLIAHMFALDFTMNLRLPLEDIKPRQSVSMHRGLVGRGISISPRKAMSAVWIEDVVERLPAAYATYGAWVSSFVKKYMGPERVGGDVWRKGSGGVLMIEDSSSSNSNNNNKPS